MKFLSPEFVSCCTVKTFMLVDNKISGIPSILVIHVTHCVFLKEKCTQVWALRDRERGNFLTLKKDSFVNFLLFMIVDFKKA